MAANRQFHLCRLRQHNRETVGWIESRGAKPGAKVGISELGGLWRVASACPIPITLDALKQKQRFDRKAMPNT